MDQSAVWPINPSWYGERHVFPACVTYRMRGFICGDCLELGLLSYLLGGVVGEISGNSFLSIFPTSWRPIFSASCAHTPVTELPSLCAVPGLLPALKTYDF
jgi:hypothetical protein